MPESVARGRRVVLEMLIELPVEHPTHLHRHRFLGVEINGQPLSGPVRDTELAPASRSVSVAFDTESHRPVAGSLLQPVVYREKNDDRDSLRLAGLITTGLIPNPDCAPPSVTFMSIASTFACMRSTQGNDQHRARRIGCAYRRLPSD